MPEIIWKGNEYTNSSKRTDNSGHAYIPFAIVDHISAGTMSSMDNWFRDPGNSVSSAHFGVSKTGEIHQYVDMRRMAWGNGATVDMYPTADKLAQIVKDNYGVNPNLYTVSIEHEGTDGTLTEAQFEASAWLHRYIRDQIAEIYSATYRFPLDMYHVIGHFQVSKKKPSCPGPNFPWQRLYDALNQTEEDETNMPMKMEDWQWKMLGDSLDGLCKKGLLTDYTWAQKAYTGTLTAAELAWLNTVIYARQQGIEV